MAYQLFQLPKQVLHSGGALKASWKVQFAYTGLSTQAPVYTSSALSVQHSQPVQADSGGTLAAIYLDPSIVYKASVYDQNDVLQYTIDPVNDSLLSQSSIGALLYPRTSYESSANVTPTDYSYPYDDARRYGHIADGTTDHTPILNKLIAISAAGGPPEYVFQRGTHYFDSRPDDITCPLVIKGQGINQTYFVRDFSPASTDIGLFNFRATSTSSHVENATVVSGLGTTGGNLVSIVQPSSGDGADWSPLIRKCRLTSDQALGGSGDSHAYALYIDGTARSSPQGQRTTLIEDCIIFGGASGAAYISGVVNFNWNNTSTYSGGGTSGAVVITGTAGVPSNYVTIRGANIYGLSLDRVNYLRVDAAEINGNITNTANTTHAVIIGQHSSGTLDTSWVDSIFIDPDKGIIRQKAGGNAVVSRYNGSNPRAGLYIAGSSGQSFIGGNLDWSSGNTFNFDITGVAWYIGDPGGNGRLSIGCATGTAGNDASVTGTSDAIRITTDGNLYPGRASSQGMTNGFFYIPSAAGAPSGTPTAITGYMPMYYDTTNNRFYVYNGAWKSVVLA